MYFVFRKKKRDQGDEAFRQQFSDHTSTLKSEVQALLGKCKQIHRHSEEKNQLIKQNYPMIEEYEKEKSVDRSLENPGWRVRVLKEVLEKMTLFDTLEKKIADVERILAEDDVKITGLEDDKIKEWENGVNSIIFALKSLSAQNGGTKSRDEKLKSTMTIGARDVRESDIPDISLLKHNNTYMDDKR
jgi:hypothetical protein